MIIGIDEVGRGCWAGPLVAAVVSLDESTSIDGLADSKLLSAKKRIRLNTEIRSQASCIGIGWVWPEEINKIGLTEAVRLAMQRAVAEITIQIKDTVIIDGNIDYLSLSNSEAVIKADGTVPAVSAASIVAKVARDAYMLQLSQIHPEYGFEKHVGYGTKFHLEALKLNGVLRTIHRLTYKPIQRLLSSV